MVASSGIWNSPLGTYVIWLWDASKSVRLSEGNVGGKEGRRERESSNTKCMYTFAVDVSKVKLKAM